MADLFLNKAILVNQTIFKISLILPSSPTKSVEIAPNHVLIGFSNHIKEIRIHDLAADGEQSFTPKSELTVGPSEVAMITRSNDSPSNKAYHLLYFKGNETQNIKLEESSSTGSELSQPLYQTSAVWPAQTVSERISVVAEHADSLPSTAIVPMLSNSPVATTGLQGVIDMLNDTSKGPEIEVCAGRAPMPLRLFVGSKKMAECEDYTYSLELSSLLSLWIAMHMVNKIKLLMHTRPSRR